MLSAIVAGALALAHPQDGIQMIPIYPPREMPSIVESVDLRFSRDYTLGPFDPGIEWNEAVPSWSLKNSDRSSIRLEAAIGDPAEDPQFYDFGLWSQAPSAPRMSAKGSKDDLAEVQTDTLVLKTLQRRIWLRFRVESSVREDVEAFPFLAVSFRNAKAAPRVEAPLESVWGRKIEVPMRSQMSYEGGNVLCSPTCISMLLWHWSKVENRPEWNLDVPVVASGVFDPNWPGTGNWPFNTAFAGSIDGLRAYVARLGSIRELEEWIEAGIPIATSVSSALLKGRPKKEPNDGHLVIVIGFTKEGDLVFNDPGRSTEVRQVYKREHFAKAWATSGNTVYIVHPESKESPENRWGHWLN